MIGQWFCGGVTFEFDGPTSSIELCHCARRQRTTGSAVGEVKEGPVEGDGEPRSVRACQVDSRIRVFAPHSGVAAQHLEHVAPGVVRRHVRMVPVASGRHDAASKRSA